MISRTRIVVVSLALVWGVVSVGSAMQGAGAADPERLEPLFPILERGQWGFIDRTGRVVIPPRFNSLVNVDLEWRVGQTLLPNQRPRPADLFMAPRVVPETTLLVGARESGRWGVVDRSGQWALMPRFDQIGPYREGFAPIRAVTRWGYADRVGRIIVPPLYEDVGGFRGGSSVVIEAGRCGVIDTAGRVVVRPRFERVVPADSVFHDGRAVVVLDEKKGYVARGGNIVIPPVFREAEAFSEGLAAVATPAGYGYIDTTGRWAITPRYQGARSFDRGLARVRLDDLYGFIDRSGTFVIEPRFDETGGFKGGEHAPVQRGKGRFGWVDRTGNWIECPYSEVEPLDDTLRVVRMEERRIGIVNAASGRVVRVFPWASVGPFSEGLASVRERRSRLGFIDSTGTLVIGTRFNQVDRFRMGLCRAAAGDTLGYIDRRGAWVWYGRFPGYRGRYPDYGR